MTGKMEKKLKEARSWLAQKRPSETIFRAEDILEIISLAKHHDGAQAITDEAKAIIYALMIGVLTGYETARRECQDKKKSLPVLAHQQGKAEIKRTDIITPPDILPHDETSLQ